MDIRLNAIEARILGVLIEKEMATPDYYPLTLNALVNACNQKSNREPVMDVDATDVTAGLDSLRSQRLVWQVRVQGSRAPKYEHNLKDFAEFSRREMALLCELLLRGPQTPGELRLRAGRLVEFESLPEVEHLLQKLANHEKGPLVVKLPRAPGRKEHRYMHLFGGEFDEETFEMASVAAPDVQAMAGGGGRTSAGERVAALEQQVADLEGRVEELRKEFLEFKRQFE